MGFVSGLLGTAGGVNGTGISGPSGVDPGQLSTAYNQTQAGIKQQQDFVNALGQQNGLGNQTSVFNQLQGVANGTGPNPAQAMLNQATGNNTANQAALMAGQRGAGANPALIARQAAMQGGANQQQAAGQAATMQAQQSLGAIGQMGGIAGQQVGQQQQGLNSLNQNSLQQQSNLMGLQSNINSANAGLAGSTMSGQQNLMGSITGGIGSALGLAEGGQVPQRYAQGTPSQPVQAGNYAPIDPMNNPFNMPPISAIPMAMPPQAPAPANAPSSGPQSRVAQHFANPDAPKMTGMQQAGNTIGKGIGAGLSSLFQSSNGPSGSATNLSDEQAMQDRMSADVMLQSNKPEQDMAASNEGMPMAAKGGKVPALVSPGEIYLKPDAAKKVAKGANPEKVGKKVPGKPKVGGAVNDYANDTVKASLDEGGIVLPRSVTQAKHPHWEAHKFVSALMAKNKGKLK